MSKKSKFKEKGNNSENKTRSVCETRMPPKRPFLQMTLTLVPADGY